MTTIPNKMLGQIDKFIFTLLNQDMMSKQFISYSFILILMLIQTACQNDPVIVETTPVPVQHSQAPVSKAKITRSGVHPAQRASTRRACWRRISAHINDKKSPKTFIFAAGAETGKLKKANQDARQFKQAMQNRFQVPDNQVCLLENVYRAEFEQALRDLKRWVKPDDLVIIFFSGHGSFIDDDNGDEADKYDDVLVTVDVKDIEWPAKKEVVVDDDLVKIVNALPTKRIVTFLDTCFSGGMYMGPQHEARSKPQTKFLIKGALGILNTWLFDAESTQKKRRVVDFAHLKGVIFAAAQENQHAWEDIEGGVFTTTFLKRLKRTPRQNLERLFNETQADLQESKRTPEIQTPKKRGNFRLSQTL
ncbi:MAG TPA: caspase family protein [Thiotrichaceae bacterium]|nr:caspase family protein [Thiotrichaceae bacterium]